LSLAETILLPFQTISLEETEKVKLMNRIDRKYWLHECHLPGLIRQISSDYYILEINGQKLMGYESVYFDTPGNSMYLSHHNRKLNRCKVRKRKYFSTGTSFFEIKLKNNKKRTVKTRVESQNGNYNLSADETVFLKENTPYSPESLSPILSNKFNRITLVSKNGQERVTIDTGLEFFNGAKKIGLEGLAVAEIKRGKGLNTSPVACLLKEKGIRQRGLSKYCTGRALLEPSLKKNAFKARLRFINKAILTNI